jgi:hypothetical protein
MINSIHINQRGFLIGKIMDLLPEYSYDQLDPFIRNFTDKQYRFWLALCYNKNLEELKKLIDFHVGENSNPVLN